MGLLWALMQPCFVPFGPLPCHGKHALFIYCHSVLTKIYIYVYCHSVKTCTLRQKNKNMNIDFGVGVPSQYYNIQRIANAL